MTNLVSRANNWALLAAVSCDSVSTHLRNLVQARDFAEVICIVEEIVRAKVRTRGELLEVIKDLLFSKDTDCRTLAHQCIALGAWELPNSAHLLLAGMIRSTETAKEPSHAYQCLQEAIGGAIAIGFDPFEPRLGRYLPAGRVLRDELRAPSIIAALLLSEDIEIARIAARVITRNARNLRDIACYDHAASPSQCLSMVHVLVMLGNLDDPGFNERLNIALSLLPTDADSPSEHLGNALVLHLFNYGVLAGVPLNPNGLAPSIRSLINAGAALAPYRSLLLPDLPVGYSLSHLLARYPCISPEEEDLTAGAVNRLSEEVGIDVNRAGADGRNVAQCARDVGNLRLAAALEIED